MKVRVGTIIESDFGRGPVVAITKEWIIHQGDGAEEYCLLRDEREYSIPVTEHEIGGGQDGEIDVTEST